MKNILCVPFAPVLGDSVRNRAAILDLAQKLADAGETPDVIVLPELAFSGYLLESLVSEVAVSEAELTEFAKTLTTSGLAARTEWVIGLPLRVGDKIYNAAAVLRDGEIIHLQKKLFLPTYGMFDEGRYFHKGSSFSIYDGALGKSAILICEDAWHTEMAYVASESGAETVFVISASPARGYETNQPAFASTLAWRNRLAVFSESYGQNYIYCNRSGVEDGVLYDGAHFVLDSAAQPVAGKTSAAGKAGGFSLASGGTRRLGFAGTSARQNDLPLVQDLLEKLRRA